MKTAIKVTTNELTTILKAMPNSIGSFAKVLQFTEPKCNKKDRDTKEPFTSTIKKLSALMVLVNTSYEKGIANAKAKEISQGKEVTEYVKGANTMPIDFSDINKLIDKIHFYVLVDMNNEDDLFELQEIIDEINDKQQLGRT